jgi:hypothetical protein
MDPFVQQAGPWGKSDESRWKINLQHYKKEREEHKSMKRMKRMKKIRELRADLPGAL